MSEKMSASEAVEFILNARRESKEEERLHELYQKAIDKMMAGFMEKTYSDDESRTQGFPIETSGEG